MWPYLGTLQTLSPHHGWTRSTSRETYNITRTAFSQQGGDGGSLVCSCYMLHTSCTAQERVCPNRCLIWKLLEESLRTTAEGLLEKSFSASWNRTSCYLNHQWARQLFAMTVGFRGPQAPWPAHFGQERPAPCLRAGLCGDWTAHYSGSLVHLIGHVQDFPDGAVVKNSPTNAADTRDMDSVPRLGVGRSPGVGNGNPHHFSCLE